MAAISIPVFPGEPEYLFIDGGYLRASYNSVMSKFFGAAAVHKAEINFQAIQVWANATKVFYYDSLDDASKGGESAEALKGRTDKQKRYFGEIDSIPGFHVKFGSVTGKKRQQKQVDVLIAVDMLSHAFNKNMKRASLLSGDLDFKPVVDALIYHGTYTRVVYERTSAAKDLYKAADHAIEIGLLDFINWSSPLFRTQNLYPKPNTGVMAAPRIYKTANSGSEDVQLLSSGHDVIFKGPNQLPTGGSLDLVFHDEARLLDFIDQAYHLRFDWKDASS